MKARSSKKKEHKRRGVDAPDPVLVEASFSQTEYAHSLLETAIIPNIDLQELTQELDGFVSEGRCEEIISMLLENQRDNISGGFNYGQGDILRHLKKFC